MDSTENSIENESFEIFENFEVLNRVWEIESFFEAIQIIHFRSRMSILLFRILNLSHVIKLKHFYLISCIYGPLGWREIYHNRLEYISSWSGFLVRLSLGRKQSFF